jgi:hypothetical protein
MGFFPFPPSSGVVEVTTVTAPPFLLPLHLPRHHLWLHKSLQSGGCFAALLVDSFRWLFCHLYFVQTDALPSEFELVVHFGGCFATSLDMGGCFAAVVLFHL